MSFTKEQLGQVIKNVEGQVIINPEIFAELVQVGFKKKELATHYEMTEAAIGRVLEALKLKIRKFKREEFIIPGIIDGGFGKEAAAQDIIKKVYIQTEDGTLVEESALLNPTEYKEDALEEVSEEVSEVVETEETVAEVVTEVEVVETEAYTEVVEDTPTNPFKVDEAQVVEEAEVVEEKVEVSETPEIPAQVVKSPWAN